VSLDIVIGAVVCSLYFTRVFRVELLPYAVIALALSVWIIYTADHLIDAKLLKWPASTLRHRFHQQHFSKLLGVVVVAVIADALALFFVRSAVLKIGLILGVLVVVYLFTHRYLKFLKEFSGAMLYTAGILVPSLSGMPANWSLGHLILLFQFFLTAFINLLLFSWFDRESDLIDRHVSFVLFFGEHVTRIFLIMLFVLQLVLAVLQVSWLDFGEGSFVILAMNGLLLLIFALSSYFSRSDRYRLAGDVVFLLPLIYLIW
jgi:hypothetical protein